MDIRNPELGAKLGLAPQDTVELVTDEWADLVAGKGERGEVTHFVEDDGTIFAYVLIGGAHFPFEGSEIEKVAPEGQRP